MPQSDDPQIAPKTALAFLEQFRHRRRFRVIGAIRITGNTKKAGGACLHGAASAIGGK
jgi:hypothetical protein